MNVNKLAGIVTTAFGIIYTVLTANLPNAAIGNPVEPKIFPFIVGIGVTVCGIGLLIQAMAKGKAGQGESPEKKPEKGPAKGISHDTKLIIFTCAIGIVYGLLFDKLGYVLSTIIFMGGLLFALNDGMKKWKSNVLIAVGFSVGIYIVFYYLLAIPLPPMPFVNF